MPLDDEKIDDLLGLSLRDRQEALIIEVNRMYELYDYQEKMLKALKVRRMRSVVECYESGVSQHVIADLIGVRTQYISKIIWEYRLRAGIPDGVTLADFESAKLETKFVPSSELKPESE